MKIVRNIIEIDEDRCDGCGRCAPSCAEGAIEIIDGKAKIVKDMYCDGLGACLGECPKGALRIIKREADAFDEEAVKKFLASKNKTDHQHVSPKPQGCPSSQILNLKPNAACAGANEPQSGASTVSTLSHWPIQIRLIPPTAPFLRRADLLVLADCTAVSLPNLHSDFMPSKAVMMGCPKFDDSQLYFDKFTQIFKAADIRSVTVVVMEVPCCAGMPFIVQKAMQASQNNIPFKTIVVSRQGKILKEKPHQRTL